MESIKHIKNISKKKVAVEKIFTNIKKRNLTILYEDLQHILDKMVIDNILHKSGSGVSRTYLIAEDPDKILVLDTQGISSNSNNNLLTQNIILEETNLEQSKDAVTEYLTKQLLSPNSKKSQMKNDKCNLNETFNRDKSFYDNEFSDESNMDKDKTIEQKKRVVITGDSMLNGIHEKGMSKNYRVKVNNCREVSVQRFWRT